MIVSCIGGSLKGESEFLFRLFVISGFVGVLRVMLAINSILTDVHNGRYPGISVLQFFQATSNTIVAIVVIIATELTIQWNNLTDVNDVSTAGQTIPVIIAAGLLLHVLYVSVNPDHDKEIQRALNPKKRKYRPTRRYEGPIMTGSPGPRRPPPAAGRGV